MSTMDKLINELNAIRENRSTQGNILTLTLQEEQILDLADQIGLYEELIEKAY